MSFRFPHTTKVLAMLGLLGLPGSAARATDPAREAELIPPALSRAAGDTVRLNAGTQAFTALLRKSSAKRDLGGIVLLHGIDESPDAPHLIHTLRKALPERGWTSLSLSAPLRESGADVQAYLSLTSESSARLQAGVAYLNAQRTAPVAVLGHRAGALMVVRYLAQQPDAAAAILINLPDVPGDDNEKELEKIKIPVLDIVGAGTNARPGEGAGRRKRLMKHNAHYRQLVLSDAGTDLDSVQDLLVNRIHGWLKHELGAEISGD